jgi:hypothetical protein
MDIKPSAQISLTNEEPMDESMDILDEEQFLGIFEMDEHTAKYASAAEIRLKNIESIKEESQSLTGRSPVNDSQSESFNNLHGVFDFSKSDDDLQNIINDDLNNTNKKNEPLIESKNMTFDSEGYIDEFVYFSDDEEFPVEKTQLLSPPLLDFSKSKKRKFETPIVTEEGKSESNNIFIDKKTIEPYWNDFTKQLSQKIPLITKKNSLNVELNNIYTHTSNYKNSWYLC